MSPSTFGQKLALLANRRNWGLFSKIFMALIGVSIVPVIACSLFFYFISRQNVEAEVSLSNLNTLKQTQIAVDNILEATERISLQIVRNKEVANFLNNPIDKTRPSHPAITNAINVADSFSEGVQYIESISIYSFLNNIMVSSGTAQRYAEMDGSFLDNYGNSLKTKGFTMWIEPDDSEVFGDKSSSLQFVEFIFETFNKPEGIVIIKLKNDEFAKLINTLYIRKSGHIFVINDRGKVILGRNRLPEAFDPADFMGRYKATGEGYYKIDKGGQPLLVSFTTSRYNHWKYVAVLPANEIYDRTSLIGGAIAFLCLIFVLLAIGLSFAASKGIYNPIAALDLWLRGHKPAKHELDLLKARNDELGRIQQEIGEQVAKLRNYFFYRLTYGSIADRDEVYNQATFLDIPVDKLFVVLLAETGVGEGGADRETIRAGVTGIVQSILAGAGCLLNVAWEYRDGSERLVAVTVFDAGQPEAAVWPIVGDAARLVRSRLGEYCRSPVTVAVGSARHGLENIHLSYNDASEVLKYKFIRGADAIIFSSEYAGGTSIDTHKYYSKSQLTNCLDARDRRQLEKLLDKFTSSMKAKISAQAVYVFYCKDIITILREHLQGFGPRFGDERAALKEMFNNFEKRFDNIDAAVAAILGCMRKVFDKLEQDTPEAARRQAVEKAVAIIAAEYGGDIGLTYVCGKIGMSEPYFSKIFKEELGQNFKEYLTGIRLARAKELLRDTDGTVAAVAAQVGYNNTNQFAKMFKKYEGITPGAYRQSARSKNRVINFRQYRRNQGR